MKALIIDDEPYVIAVVKMLVNWDSHGVYTILSAGSAEEALTLISQHRPELILSDINLPGLSGLDLVEQIRRMSLSAQVIFITAYSDFSYAQRAIQLDCVDYLLKPLEEELLNRAVEKALKRVHEEKPPFSLPMDTPESTAAEDAESVSYRSAAEICRAVQRYLRQHYAENISLDSLSLQFGISPSHLSRSYKKELGTGLIDDLTMIRLKHGLEHLRAGRSTAEVSEAVGFTDAKYFNRVFKKYYACTPGEYRKRSKKNEAQ